MMVKAISRPLLQLVRRITKTQYICVKNKKTKNRKSNFKRFKKLSLYQRLDGSLLLLLQHHCNDVPSCSDSPAAGSLSHAGNVRTVELMLQKLKEGNETRNPALSPFGRTVGM